MRHRTAKGGQPETKENGKNRPPVAVGKAVLTHVAAFTVRVDPTKAIRQSAGNPFKNV
jgi:hypothetical protein